MSAVTPDPLNDEGDQIGAEHVDNAIEQEGDTVITEEEDDVS